MTATKTKTIKKEIVPSWDNHDEMSTHEYWVHWHHSMQYYNINYSNKDLKPAVIKWMQLNGFDIDTITQYKDTTDWRTTSTMGAIAACLLNGMPSIREDFNNGKCCAEWLTAAISRTIEDDQVAAEESAESDVKKTVNIQQKIQNATYSIIDSIDDAIEQWIKEPDNFQPFKSSVTFLKSNNAAAPHCRIIKDHFSSFTNELKELASGNADEQLRESYSSKARKHVRAMIAFMDDMFAACDMVITESRVNSKPRGKPVKVKPREQLLDKLKYCKTFEPLKLVSANPLDIFDATVLYVYNTKLRKLGKYVTQANKKFSIKGTTLLNFDETKSVQKSISKPQAILNEIKELPKGKVSMYFDDKILTMPTKLTGRFSEDILIYKVF